MLSRVRGLARLEAALTAWARLKPPARPMFPDEVFTAIAGGFDVRLTYDIDAMALVQRNDDPALRLPPHGYPQSRTLLEALHSPGSMLRVKHGRLELAPAAAADVAKHTRRLDAARRGRTVHGPLLKGVNPADVWFDGTAALDVNALVGATSAQRRRVVERAAALVSHRWQARPTSAQHRLGPDAVWTDTPDDTFIEGGFSRRGENVGIPYFWGGFSNVDQFDRGIAAGLPAGHIFAITPTFRKDNPFTPLGVGVDCSGFVSQAWGLNYKMATGALAECTTPLTSYDQLQPGDIVMKVWQHVMLFVGRRGDKLLFMESTPPRCIGQAFTAEQLAAWEMTPRAATWLDETKR